MKKKHIGEKLPQPYQAFEGLVYTCMPPRWGDHYFTKQFYSLWSSSFRKLLRYSSLSLYNFYLLAKLFNPPKSIMLL